MPEEPFKNREILEMFANLKETLAEHGRTHDTILLQVQKTNGRVTQLEKFRWAVGGAITILSTLVVPLLAWALFELAHLDDKIDEAITNSLSAYEIDYQEEKAPSLPKETR